MQNVERKNAALLSGAEVTPSSSTCGTEEGKAAGSWISLGRGERVRPWSAEDGEEGRGNVHDGSDVVLVPVLDVLGSDLRREQRCEPLRPDLRGLARLTAGASCGAGVNKAVSLSMGGEKEKGKCERAEGRRGGGWLEVESERRRTSPLQQPPPLLARPARVEQGTSSGPLLVGSEAMCCL